MVVVYRHGLQKSTSLVKGQGEKEGKKRGGDVHAPSGSQGRLDLLTWSVGKEVGRLERGYSLPPK